MDWSRVYYCDVCISYLDSHSDGTHSLQRIHWWASNAIFLQTCSDEETNPSWIARGWVICQLFFNFCVNYTLTIGLMQQYHLTTEIPIYHILNARITFGNLNGCEEGGLPRVDAEGDGQKDSPGTETPSPGSDSSSVSSSSSTSKNQPAGKCNC